MSVSCARFRLHTNRGFAPLHHQRPPATLQPSTSGTDSRCRNGTDPAHRRIHPLKLPVYQKPRSRLSVNYPQHATNIRRLWGVLAKWNHIIRPAMPTSVPPRDVIAFSLSLDSLIWFVHPQSFSLCFPNRSRLPAPNRVSQSHCRNQERSRGTYREWFVPVRIPP